MHTEVICENGISHGDVACNSLIEAWILVSATQHLRFVILIRTPFSKNAIRSSEMLLAIQSLLFQRVEFWIRPDLQRPAIFGLAQRANAGVSLLFGYESRRNWRHGYFLEYILAASG